MSKHLGLKGSGPVKMKKTFPQTIAHKKFETNSTFRLKYRTTGKVLMSLFQEFTTTNNKSFILAESLGTRLSFYEV